MTKADQFRLQVGVLEHGRIHEVVVQDHVGLLKTLDAAVRDQAGMAGASADQIDRTGRELI